MLCYIILYHMIWYDMTLHDSTFIYYIIYCCIILCYYVLLCYVMLCYDSIYILYRHSISIPVVHCQFQAVILEPGKLLEPMNWAAAPETWRSRGSFKGKVLPMAISGSLSWRSGWWWLEHDCYFPIDWESSSQLTHIFQGVETTNQRYYTTFFGLFCGDIPLNRP